MGGAALLGGILTNDSNESIAANNSAFNAEQAEKNRAFNAAEAEKSRDWQEQMFGTSSTFNAGEAQKTRDFQERMRATQYQTAIQDMRKAGLNPMLAYSQGGAGTPNGATATSSAGSGAQASGQAASAASNPVLTNPIPAAVQATLSTAMQGAQIDKVQADAELARAQARSEQERPQNIRADTIAKSATTDNINALTQKVSEEIKKVVNETENVKEDTWLKRSTQTLQYTQERLNKALEDYHRGQISFTELKGMLTLAETRLTDAKARVSSEGADYVESGSHTIRTITGAISQGVSSALEAAQRRGMDLDLKGSDPIERLGLKPKRKSGATGAW